MSPEGMRKAARNVQDACPEVLEWHSADQYPKLFQYIRGERCLHAETLLEDSILKPVVIARFYTSEKTGI